MGSWNGTCGISNLSIGYGDPIVAMLIAKFNYKDSGGYSGYCYNNGLYQPVSLPFYGRYNDYGGITEIEETPVFEDLRKIYLIDKNLSIEDWLEGVERDKVSIHYNCLGETVECGVGLWMMHREIYEGLVNEGIYRTYEGNSIKHLIQGDAKHFRNALKNPKGEWMKMAIDGIPKNGYALTLSMLSCGSDIESIEKYVNYFTVYLHCGSGFAGKGLVTGQQFRTYQENAIRAVLEDDQEYWDALVKAVAGYAALDVEMSSLRIGYVPQSGKGSQGNNERSHVHLNNLRKALIEKKKAEELGSLEEGEDPMEYYDPYPEWK